MKTKKSTVLILTSRVEQAIVQLIDLLKEDRTVQLHATNFTQVQGDRRDAWSRLQCYWIDPILTMFRVAPVLWRYKTIITYYHRYSYWLGILRKIFNRSSDAKCIWVGFAPNPPRSGAFGYLKECVTRQALGGHDLIICNTQPVVDMIKSRFPKVAQRVTCVHWGGKSGQPVDPCVVDGEYVFCGGRTNRDFDTVLHAVIELGCPAVFVTAKEFTFDTTIPHFVSVYRDIPEPTFYDLMKKAGVVVIALKRADVSSGQVVLCSAMANAKAVVVSNTAGLADYITDGKDSLLYKPADVEDLKAKLGFLLANFSVRQALGQAARSTYEKNFNSRAFAQGLYDKIVDIASFHSE